MKVKVLKLTCKRCKHEWRPRNDYVLICPRCKSVHWNEPKAVKK